MWPGRGITAISNLRMKVSRSLRDHEHLAVADLVLSKNIRIGFRIYLNFRVGKARLDRSDGLDFVGNGDKK
jgi:hypothetical protein